MDELINWVIINKNWLFSGLGLAVFTFVGRLIYKKSQAQPSQKIRSGDSSANIQIGRDFQIKGGSNRDGVE